VFFDSLWWFFCVLVLCGKSLTKSQVLAAIAALFAEASGTPASAQLVLCYSGPGVRTSGGWKLSDGSIVWEEVISLWKNSAAARRPGAHLSLLLDSCYSGVWSRQAASAAAAGTDSAASSSDQKQAPAPLNVTVQAATLPEQPSLESLFTPLWAAYATSARSKDSIREEVLTVLGPSPCAYPQESDARSGLIWPRLSL
jgi:hypothetical protein